MFSIGQFSRITGLTVKTIRLYHEKELLIPKWVDETTGYRYFDGRNVEQARAISYLRELGPYEHLSRSYAKIMDYIQRKKYKTLLPIREVYLKGPWMIFRGNPNNYLTEIQFMISNGKD